MKPSTFSLLVLIVLIAGAVLVYGLSPDDMKPAVFQWIMGTWEWVMAGLIGGATGSVVGLAARKGTFGDRF